MIGQDIAIMNVNADKAGEDQRINATAPHSHKHIAAGDLDGDGVAEIVGNEDGGGWPWNNDHLHVYDLNGKNLDEKASHDIDPRSRDIVVSHFGNAGRIAALDSGPTLGG